MNNFKSKVLVITKVTVAI